MAQDSTERVDIVSDERAVWINDAAGCCLGRFSRFGIEVHKDAAGPVEGRPCLDCVPGLPNAAGWERFKAAMREHHNVDVPERHRPTFLDTSNP